ncbi:MAG: hypothetical protein A3J79_06505 [Elusimicrobia bacterium RIFOXYB2_FULL_62_6]|nr:MAG: hypothetical protein A3J79_06505 [Elusimicrobia bacterium RIFOXYB2_FULL_62_6]
MGNFYFIFYSGTLTYLVVSTLKRRGEKYGLGTVSQPDLFLVGTPLYLLSFLANIFLAVKLTPNAFLLLQAAGAALAGGYAAVMELRYRAAARFYRREMLDEIAALWKELDKDPLNAAWLERLAELYKKTGDIEAAVACAGKAFALDPTRLNEWKLEALKETPVAPIKPPGPLEAALGILTVDIGVLKKQKESGPGGKS